MKKVNLIGKKIMSAGLAASLLVTSLGNTSCFAEDPTTSAKTAVSTQQEKNESGNVNTTVNVNINNPGNSQLIGSEKKSDSNNRKKESKPTLKKAFDVTKWVLISGFLAYAGYKNGQDIINCSKELWNFILENEDNFKEVLDGGIAAVKGLGNAAKGSTQLIWKIISFLAKHTEATKNVMAAVGTYNVYQYLKNKISNFTNKKDNKKVENSFKFEGSITKK